MGVLTGASTEPDKTESAEAIEAAKPEAEAEAEASAAAPSRILAPFAVRPRLSRAAVLAIAMALSAAAGSAVGTMAASAFAKPQTQFPDDGRSVEVNALRGVITQLSAEVAALKASVDSAGKATQAQMAKIADRVERAEHAQAEPAARVAKLSELVEKIERSANAAPGAVSPEVTGSIAPKQQDRPPVLSNWVLRDVYGGRAMVDHDRMGLFEVVPGANLPGIGRVEAIRRQDGRWVVVTPKGLITSLR